MAVRVIRTITAALGAIACAAVFTPTGAAGDATTPPLQTGRGNVTGSDISQNWSQAPEDFQLAANKMAVAQAWHAATFGGGSDAIFHEARANYAAQYGEETAGATSTDDLTMSTMMAAPASYTVSMPHRAQSNSYYCGPASGAMLLNATGHTTSATRGFSLSQANLARDAYMATDANGKTSWSTSRFRIGLNEWRQGTWAGFYVDLGSPSNADMEVALTYDTYQNNTPFGADTVEWAGGAHYNNHPDYLEIGHWIAAYGYWNSGDNAYFKDPATEVWSGVLESFGATTSSFTSTYLQNNGITW